MFVDICIPKNNEIEFIDIAKKLNTKKLCFIDSKNKEISFPHYLGSFKKGKLLFLPISKEINKKNCVYFYTPNKAKRFHFPSTITQVTIKKIKELKSIFLIPFSKVNEENIEEIKFLVKLCKKYSVSYFISSFASTPYELKSKESLSSIALNLGFDFSKKSDSFLVFNKFCSAIFL